MTCSAPHAGGSAAGVITVLGKHPSAVSGGHGVSVRCGTLQEDGIAIRCTEPTVHDTDAYALIHYQLPVVVL